MSVRRAVEIFSPPVTAALKYLADLADGIVCKETFAKAAKTVEFMENCYKWRTRASVNA